MNAIRFYSKYTKRTRKAAKQSNSYVPTTPSSLLLVAGAYFGLINAASAALFWYDKHQATTHGWRIPEIQLQLSALLGGWIGGMYAMKEFRHKTKKTSFRVPYFICVGVNVLGVAGGLAMMRYSNGFRGSVLSGLTKSNGLAALNLLNKNGGAKAALSLLKNNDGVKSALSGLRKHLRV